MPHTPSPCHLVTLSPCHRRGGILLVVLVLLALFAAVGVSFVFYASSHQTAARYAVEAQNQSRPDVDPELLLAYFLGQLIYDVPDDGSGVYSALRGHSLARNMYGSRTGPTPPGSAPNANLVPFNGVGRLRSPSPFGTLIPGAVLQDDQLISYVYYPDDPQLPPAQRFLRDPERPGWRANLAAPSSAYTVGCNAPYTYPDLNNVFLAAVRADGSVLLPSFHRPWAAAVAGAPPGAGEFWDPDTGKLNPWWAPGATPPPWFKYTTLRPLPALNPGFPSPEDGGGDVKNLVGGLGRFRRINPQTGQAEYWNNDSFWMDLGFPVMLAPDGRKYKPLFAVLITDLDNRLNANVHGNLRGPGQSHASNQGWGPWEVNLSRVLSRGGGTEWRNLLQGSTVPPLPGRYGGNPAARRFGTPGFPGETALPALLTHSYSQMDFDGVNEWTGWPSGPLLLPSFGAPPHSPAPSYLTPVGTYAGYGNASLAERREHPLLYDGFWPSGDNRRFPVSDMEALLRYGDMGSPALTADLFRLCPANFADPRIRRLITTDSTDLDRPGVPPWIHHPPGFPYTLAPTTDPDQPALPQGPPIPFPTTSLKRGSAPFGNPLNNGEFNGVDWRAGSAALGRVNLNRPLPPYPHQGSGKAPPFGPPLTVMGGQVTLTVPFHVDAPNGPIWKQFLWAQEARQQLANDIYRRLLVVTGVTPLRPEQHPQAPPAEFLRVRRWLAQLAVNIVDYIDEDDISTPFCFYTAEDYKHLPFLPPFPPDPGRVDPTRAANGPAGDIQWPMYWVFGTELPRLVVNEAVAEVEMNDPDEAYQSPIRVFLELHNPWFRMAPPGTYRPDSFPVPLRMGWGGAYAPYRVMVGVKSVVPGHPAGAAILPGLENNNVLGNPELAAVRASTTDGDFFGPLATISGGEQPPWFAAKGPTPYGGIPSPYVPPHGPETDLLPSGFVLLGPPEEAPASFAAYDPFRRANRRGIPGATPLLRTPSLQYLRSFHIRQRSDPPDERTAGVTVVLRRLANPALPFDGRRSIGGLPNVTYNPYVTVDYLDNIPLQAVTSGVRLPITSLGRPQPYAAYRALLQPQTLRSGPRLSHSFGRDNVPAAPFYDWLTHLDRPLISPMELLHVSGYQPYQLTQRFISPDSTGQLTKFDHRAPWSDDGLPGGASHRLYRFLEFAETGPRAAGVAAGGRIAGKVNINTIWDVETWQALCDAQPSTYFGDADVQNAFTRLLYDSSAGSINPLRRTQGSVPTAADRPFWALPARRFAVPYERRR